MARLAATAMNAGPTNTVVLRNGSMRVVCSHLPMEQIACQPIPQVGSRPQTTRSSSKSSDWAVSAGRCRVSSRRRASAARRSAPLESARGAAVGAGGCCGSALVASATRSSSRAQPVRCLPGEALTVRSAARYARPAEEQRGTLVAQPFGNAGRFRLAAHLPGSFPVSGDRL